jgi:hypothetical protein
MFTLGKWDFGIDTWRHKMPLIHELDYGVLHFLCMATSRMHNEQPVTALSFDTNNFSSKGHQRSGLKNSS